MKKIILCLAIFVISIYLLSAQIKLVNAATSNQPITNPITAPISYYAIAGKVMYKIGQIYVPASGAKVSLFNFNTNRIIYAQTDQIGNYHFDVKSGKYLIRVSDSKETLFQTNNLVVKVSGTNKFGVDFLGIIK